MFIVERIAPSNLRIRLAGMKVCEMLGVEVRGMQPGVLVREADRARFERLLGIVMSEPAVVELGLETSGRAVPQRGTMLLMPLRSDFGEVNRVLGCASIDLAFLNAPIAFSISDVSINPVQIARETENRVALPGFAEEASAFERSSGPRLRAIDGNPDAPTPTRGARPKLRVVDSD
jgi:hypothetical protein